MKKIFWCVVLGTAFFLIGCSNEKHVEGQVVEIQSNEDIGVVSFIMQTEESEEIGILLTDETSVVSWMGKLQDSGGRLTAEDFENMYVSVLYRDSSARTLGKEDGTTVRAYKAQEVRISGGDTRED